MEYYYVVGAVFVMRECLRLGEPMHVAALRSIVWPYTVANAIWKVCSAALSQSPQKPQT